MVTSVSCTITTLVDTGLAYFQEMIISVFVGVVGGGSAQMMSINRRGMMEFNHMVVVAVHRVNKK